MLDAQHLTDAQRAAMVQRDLDGLAPKFHAAVQLALGGCHAANLDAVVYEAVRSDALQQAYYALGRTVVPPTAPVTNAASALYSWHGYGLAVDVISQSKQWTAGADWFHQVAQIFKRQGCEWGGDWLGNMSDDSDHFQFGGMKPSPSSEARTLYASGGVEAVWRAVGAL